MKWIFLLLLCTNNAFCGALEKGEIAIPLNARTTVSNAGQRVVVAIFDHGSDTISVQINYGQPDRLNKPRGTDVVGDNLLLIHSGTRWDLCYVNSPRAPHNHCLLKVIPRK